MTSLVYLEITVLVAGFQNSNMYPCSFLEIFGRENLDSWLNHTQSFLNYPFPTRNESDLPYQAKFFRMICGENIPPRGSSNHKRDDLFHGNMHIAFHILTRSLDSVGSTKISEQQWNDAVGAIITSEVPDFL